MWIKLPLTGVLLPEAVMPGSRPRKKGSFGGHLEELVKHFPDEVATMKAVQPARNIDRRALKEKIDIHARLFQMAWQVEEGREG